MSLFVYVDRRDGSEELCKPLQKLGVQTRLHTLPFGDVAFTGNGPEGEPMRVGIEFKTLSELLGAITSGRFVGHQLPGMVKQYPIRYLLIEGPHRCEQHSGMLQVPRRIKTREPGSVGTRWQTEWVDAGYGQRRWMYSQLVEWLNGLPMRVIKTGSRTETLHTIQGLATWWGKDWSDHGSLNVIYGGMAGNGSHTLTGDDLMPLTASLIPVSETRKVLGQLPHVGWEYSAPAEERFGTVLKAVKGGVASWAEIRAEGLTKGGRKRPRIGEARAKRIVAFLRRGA